MRGGSDPVTAEKAFLGRPLLATQTMPNVQAYEVCQRRTLVISKQAHIALRQTSEAASVPILPRLPRHTTTTPHTCAHRH